jgi:hypothetical protein
MYEQLYRGKCGSLVTGVNEYLIFAQVAPSLLPIPRSLPSLPQLPLTVAHSPSKCLSHPLVSGMIAAHVRLLLSRPAAAACSLSLFGSAAAGGSLCAGADMRECAAAGRADGLLRVCRRVGPLRLRHLPERCLPSELRGEWVLCGSAGKEGASGRRSNDIVVSFGRCEYEYYWGGGEGGLQGGDMARFSTRPLISPRGFGFRKE